MGELCSIQSGKSDTKDAVLDGPYAFFDRSKTIKRSNRFIRDCEALIVPGEGTEFLPRHFRGKFDLHQRAYALFNFSPRVEVRFLYYYLHHVSEYFPRVAVGATVKSLRLRHFKQLPVRLVDIEHQHRIVAILDEAFEGIATAKSHAEKNLRNARALLESQTRSVFSRREEGWVERPLGDIGKVSMCKRVFKEQTTSKGEIPFYKIGTFGREADAFISSKMYREYRGNYPFPKRGDVLISAAGTIGRRVIYDGDDAYFQDSNIVWIANDQTQVLNHYLYHFYGVCEWNSTRGATISRLYNDNLRQIVIAFPSSLHEQLRIATELDDLAGDAQRLKSIWRKKLLALDELKQSILHQAFSGQL